MIQWIISRLTKKSIPIVCIELKGDIKDKDSFKVNINSVFKDDLYFKDYIEKLLIYIRNGAGITNKDLL